MEQVVAGMPLKARGAALRWAGPANVIMHAFGTPERHLVARLFVVLAALSGLVAVAIGAFGAHVLKGRLAADMLLAFETGVRYQMFHVAALLAAAWVAERWPGAWARAAGWSFLAGTLLFSGSLYLMVLTGERGIAALTPFGGLAFLAGWGALALAAAKGR